MTKTLFDHLNAIYQDQRIDYYDLLDESDRKTFNIYMINRFISMNPDYIPVVNEIQQYWENIKSREVYLFYSQLLPKKKQFNKYIKSSTESPEYEDWVIDILKLHFQVSKFEALDYLRIYYLSPSHKEQLKELLESYGVDPKLIKKAKL